MNKLKVLGVAMLAVFAISAIAASAAQAGEFHSEIENTFLFGEEEGENIITTTAGNIKFKEASLDSLNAQVGTKVAESDFKTSTTIMQPQYSGVKAFGQTATADNPPSQTGSACDFHFVATAAGANNKISGTPVPGAGTAACEIKITVPAGNCNIVINNQTPTVPTATFTNVSFGTKGAYKLSWAVSGLTYTVEGAEGSICGRPGVHTDGKYSGNDVIRGYNSATHTAAFQVGVSYK